MSYDGGGGCHVATSDPIAEIIGDYRAFAAMQRDRLVARGIDIAPYPLSHLAVRVADWDLYVHQRTLLERHARANSENVWNGRPISLIVLAEPLDVLDGTPVSLIELIPPVHQRVYRMGLEHLGVVVGEDIDDFSRVHRAVLRPVRGLHSREVLSPLLVRRRHPRGTALRRLQPRRRLGAAAAGHRHRPEPAPALTEAAPPVAEILNLGGRVARGDRGVQWRRRRDRPARRGGRRRGRRPLPIRRGWCSGRGRCDRRGRKPCDRGKCGAPRSGSRADQVSALRHREPDARRLLPGYKTAGWASVLSPEPSFRQT